MAINLVGKGEGEDEKKSVVPISFHLPDEPLAESRTKTVKLEPPKKKDIPQEVVSDDIDLAENIKKRRALYLRLAQGVSGIIILMALSTGSYYAWLYINSQPNIPTPPTAVTPTFPTSPPTEPSEPLPVESPTEEPLTQPGEQPPTALAPLRGALIRFEEESEVFLIENNGELRIVVQNNVIFDNKQTLSQINRTLIYNLPAKWKDIRRGSPEVSGQVDFDPRVLTISELLPFIQ